MQLVLYGQSRNICVHTYMNMNTVNEKGDYGFKGEWKLYVAGIRGKKRKGNIISVL